MFDTPKSLTLVISVDQGFLFTGGGASIDLGPFFARWQSNGGHGLNVTNMGGTVLGLLGNTSKIEDIPSAAGEEQTIHLTISAPQPMPMPGSNHTYHVSLMEMIDDAVVGGVDYMVTARALDTDTDADGQRDVEAADDDNDGTPDEMDSNPVDPCLPVAELRINYLGPNVVISWTNSGYRLQAAPSLNPPVVWTSLSETSPVTEPASGTYQFFRLICP